MYVSMYVCMYVCVCYFLQQIIFTWTHSILNTILKTTYVVDFLLLNVYVTRIIFYFHK